MKATVSKFTRLDTLSSNSIASAVVASSLSNYGIKFLNVLTGIILARSLGAFGRGEWEAMRIWPAAIIAVGVVGLDQALIYFISKSPDKSSNYVMTYWVLSLLLSGGWLLAGWYLLTFLLANQSSDVIMGAKWYMLTVPLGFWATSFAALSALKQYMWWNLVRLVIPVLWLAGLLLLVITDSFTPLAVMWASVGAMGIRLVIIIIILTTNGVDVGFRYIDPTTFKPMFRYGIQSSLGSTSQFLNFRLDVLILVGILSPSSVGLYAVGVSWSALVDPLVMGLAQMVFPELASKRQTPAAHQLLARYARVAVLMAVVTSIPLIILTPLAIPLFYGKEFALAVPAAIVLTAAAIPRMLNGVLGSGLRGLGQPIGIAWAEGTGLMVTLGMLYLLVPMYGIMGAATTSLTAYLLTFSILTLVISRHLQRPVYSFIVPTAADIRYMTNSVGRLLGRRKRVE